MGLRSLLTITHMRFWPATGSAEKQIYRHGSAPARQGDGQSGAVSVAAPDLKRSDFSLPSLFLCGLAEVDTISENLRSVIEAALSDIEFRVLATAGKSGDFGGGSCGNFKSGNGMEAFKVLAKAGTSGELRRGSCANFESGSGMEASGTNREVNAEETIVPLPEKDLGIDRLSNDGDPVVADAPESTPLYPIPLSPLSGELAKGIEYERAMAAEAAMKSGPALSRSGVLFEDEWLLVINKPCGVYSEHVLATVPSLLTPTAALMDSQSLSRLTLRRPVENQDPHLHMANRLDRDTTGVMVITKCRAAAAKLSNIFTRRLVQKSYIALCYAPRPSWKKLTVESGHGRSRFGAWRVYSKKDVGRELPGGSVVRDMTTHLLVLAINNKILPQHQTGMTTLSDLDNRVTAGHEGSSGILHANELGIASEDEFGAPSEECLDEVLIRAIPHTGRTHQIRLHCQFVGLPLRGDVKYGGCHFRNGVTFDHHALHAESLSFRHPFTFEELNFVAPLPQWAIAVGEEHLSD